MAQHLPEALRCPICGDRPDVGECGPATKETGPLGWYAGCYKPSGPEHCVMANGDTRSQAIINYNAEVAKLRRPRLAATG